jgi:UDP-N-acetylmuramoyl-L-alanyl-D-glutamate--2,6-diaminopimelate ligase
MQSIGLERVSARGSEGLVAANGRKNLKLGELLALVPLQSVRGPRDAEIRGVAVDSREVSPGFLFAALPGEKTDGHLFLEDAVSRGAVAILSERPADSRRFPGVTWIQTPDARKAAGVLAARAFSDPARNLQLVGITGTNGKTTTAYLVDGLVSRLAPPSAMLGTVVAKIGDRSRPTRHTTPESPDLQSFLADAVAAGCRYGALEVSSHGLALSRLEGTEFQVAVFTNLSRDHLDFHRDMEDYFQAKRLLFTRYLRPRGTAVIAIDDAHGERLSSELSNRTITFGISPAADLSIVEVEATLQGIRICFREDSTIREIRSPLLGRYNALNLLGAFAAVRALGFSNEDILETLPSVEGAPGRFERVAPGRPFDVVVDYAHTDDALRKLLEAVRPLTRGKLWVVFGCGGERDRAKRPLMGNVASRLADHVVLTSDNPRGENPEAILREIQLGTKESSVGVEVEADRRTAIALALQRAKPGDVVVVAGKGHEPYQIVGGRVLDFDDRVVVSEILADIDGVRAPTGEGTSS